MDQNAQASPAGAKRKRRMGVTEGFKIELTVDQTVAMLKAEAQSVKNTGIASFIDADKDAVVMETLQPHLNSHLSVFTNTCYPDKDGAKHAEENQTTMDEFECKFRDHFEGFHDGTGTAAFSTSTEICMNLYCDLVTKIRFDSSNMGKDGQPIVQLDKAAGQQAKMPGGFASPYQLVATPHFNKAMQDRCIFGFKTAGTFGAECGPVAKALNAKVLAQMKVFFPS
jgi:hypothetical protein